MSDLTFGFDVDISGADGDVWTESHIAPCPSLARAAAARRPRPDGERVTGVDPAPGWMIQDGLRWQLRDCAAGLLAEALIAEREARLPPNVGMAPPDRPGGRHPDDRTQGESKRRSPMGSRT